MGKVVVNFVRNNKKQGIMELDKLQADQLSRLLKSCVTTSNEIAEISGADKVTVTLVAVGLTLTVTGLLRSVNG